MTKTKKTNNGGAQTGRDERSQFDAAPGYVAAGGVLLEIGKEYACRNARKGTFRMKITALSGEWITGTITDGVAKAIMSYNVRDAGEKVTVRECHSLFTPVAT